ncbi:hypothetical protein HN51_045016 [Arachis hypogaea]
MLWNERPLVLRDIFINEKVARNAIIDMAGGLAVFAKMKKRLTIQPPITAGGDRVSSSAIVSRQPKPRRVEESGEGQGLEVHILEGDSRTNSLARKKLKNVGQDDDAALAPFSFKHVLDKGFRTLKFVDHHFMDEDTKAVLAKMPLEDTLPRVQRMFLCSTTYVRDIDVEISILRSKLLSKDKMIAEKNIQIQKLNNSVTDLQGKQTSLENEVKSLKEAKVASDSRERALKKQVFELTKKIKELNLSVRKAEQTAVDGIFYAEKNILDQIKLKAPDLDISEVVVFKKVVDRKVVSIL